MSTYKKGSFVRIKTADQFIAAGYSKDGSVAGISCSVPLGWNSEMHTLCGQVVEIESVQSTDRKNLKEPFYYSVKGNYWQWGLEMFDLSYCGPVHASQVAEFTHVVTNPYEGWSCWKEQAEALGATNFKSGQMASMGSRVRIVNKSGQYIIIADEKGQEFLVCNNAIEPLIKVKVEKARVSPETPKTEPVKSPMKEKEDMNVRALEKIADKKLSAELELAGATGLDGDILSALEEQIAEQKKNNAKAAATVILEVVKEHSKAIESRVDSIRSYKRAMENEKEQIEKLNLAKAYGLETNNWLPLTVLLGITYRHRLEDETLADIPKDWKPAATTEEATKKKK